MACMVLLLCWGIENNGLSVKWLRNDFRVNEDNAKLRFHLW